MNKTHKDLLELLTKWCPTGDIDKRRVECTPCAGNYGTVACWAVIVNGSPPRGSLFISPEYGLTAFYMPIDVDRIRRINGDKQLGVIRRFYNEHLKERKTPLTLGADI